MVFGPGGILSSRPDLSKSLLRYMPLISHSAPVISTSCAGQQVSSTVLAIPLGQTEVHFGVATWSARCRYILVQRDSVNGENSTWRRFSRRTNKSYLYLSLLPN